MNPSALAYASQLLTVLPALLQAGIAVADTVQMANDRLRTMDKEGRSPTPDEWDELNARIKSLRAELHRAPVGSSNPGTEGEAAGS